MRPHRPQVRRHPLEHLVDAAQVLALAPVHVRVDLVLPEVPQHEAHAPVEVLGQLGRVAAVVRAQQGHQHVVAPVPPRPLPEVAQLRLVAQPAHLLAVVAHEVEGPVLVAHRPQPHLEVARREGDRPLLVHLRVPVPGDVPGELEGLVEGREALEGEPERRAVDLVDPRVPAPEDVPRRQLQQGRFPLVRLLLAVARLPDRLRLALLRRAGPVLLHQRRDRGLEPLHARA